MEQFMELHKTQLELFNIPQRFWPTLYEKLTNEIFDSGDVFSLLKIDYENEDRSLEDPLWRVQVKVEDGIKYDDPKQIYLIDHAWTYEMKNAKQYLHEVPGLVERMSNMMGLDYKEDDKDEVINLVYEEMWKYNLSYNILNEKREQVPVWYLMDELGTGIEHSDDPNCRCVLFIHQPQNIVYSLLFPIKNIEFAETITRNFVEGANDNLTRNVLLLPVKWHSFLDIDFVQNPPNSDYFLLGHVEESLPISQNIEVYMNGVTVKEKYKVCTNYGLIHEFLNDEHFEIVPEEEDADILWYLDHFKDYEKFSKDTPNKFVNQFPFEHVITVKDLLSIVCRRQSEDSTEKYNSESLDTYPIWLPTTYSLRNELAKFISYYQHRQRRSDSSRSNPELLDNHWIIKAYNLSRGMDMHITNNINCIVKLSQQLTPKIAQKYVANPVLFHRSDNQCNVKFDIRYMVLVQTLKPLQIYVYRKFFVRFANKEFALKDFDDYERHFTVMNYAEDADLYHLRCEEFIQKWTEQYPNNPWDDIEKNICDILKQVFQCALKLPPPQGMCPNRQSRAMYGADLMLEWRKDVTGAKYMQPKLLEINWAADCSRACQYYPSFFNDVFSLLFRNEQENKFILI